MAKWYLHRRAGRLCVPCYMRAQTVRPARVRSFVSLAGGYTRTAAHRTGAHERRSLMTEIGYVLSSEETSPNDLVRNARRAEEVGFTTAWVSDHYHPWIDEQGQSPFVWLVIGGIAAATERIRLGTGVTCPSIRIHPAILAQAAATSAAMMPGRFFLGVGA